MVTHKTSPLVGVLSWLCITLFYCYQYILRVLPNVIMPDVIEQFHASALDFGVFAGQYYIGYIAIHIPIGILFTRFGSKIVLTISILLTTIGLIPIIYFDNWQLALWGRVITGIGSGASAVGAIQVFRILYPVHFTRVLGYMVFFGTLTVVYVVSPLSALIAKFGMINIINALIYSGIILAIVTFCVMPKATEETSRSNIWTDIKSVLCNYKILIISILAGMMVGGLEGFADAWGSAFLSNVYGVTKSAADAIVAKILLGMCAGCIIIPFIADYFRFHIGISIISGIVMILCFILLLQQLVPSNMLVAVCFIIGIFSAYQIAMISKISTFVSEERSSLAASIANMFIMSFGWVFHNSIGFMLDRLDKSIVRSDTETAIYSDVALVKSISIIPWFMFVAVIGLSCFIIYEILRVRRIQKISAKA